MSKKTKINIAIAATLIPLFALNLVYGAVSIPVEAVADILLGNGSGQPTWDYIVKQARLPQATTAILCGSSLAVSGLLLQTAFRNPLAGPSIFGINSGASLGAACVLLGMGGGMTLGTVTFTGFIAVITASFAGAMAVMAVLLAFSRIVKNNVMLLITGIMIGYVASSALPCSISFLPRRAFIHTWYGDWATSAAYHSICFRPSRL